MLCLEKFFLFTLAFSCANGYKFFQQRIPNGDKVINPCDGSIWQGVGHENYAGGGVRNPFGKAFEAGGKIWTKALCQADSDGDGRSNGDELGDPDCVWKPGNTPARVSSITHPGICDPYDSAKCQGQFLDCANKKEFDCPAINSPDVKSINFTIPETSVPARETTLMCAVFKLPADQKYDVIASRPLIDNANVMHHMTSMGCTGLDESEHGNVYECTMIDQKCTEILDLWTFGMNGYCQPDFKGKRFGKGESEWMVIQYHWTNPEERTDYKDASGVELFYTPKLRPYKEGVFIMGDMGIFIPPNSKRHIVDTICTTEGTEWAFSNSVNISSILFHMHYRGRRMWFKQYRNNTLVRSLDENPFSYESPILHNFDNDPIVMQPGDEIRMRCEFNTEGFDDWIYYGDGTYDEMCFGIFNYWPASDVHSCISLNNELNLAYQSNCSADDLIDEIVATLDLFRLACNTDNHKDCTKECHQYTEALTRQFPDCFLKEIDDYKYKHFYATALRYSLWNKNKDKKYGDLHNEIPLAFRGCDLYPPTL